MTFTETHPWIRFSADLRSAPPKLWVQLGECQSKCRQLAQTPLSPADGSELNRTFLARVLMGTSAIEGNPLSEEEVRLHLDVKPPPVESLRLVMRGIDNMLEAFRLVMDELRAGNISRLAIDRICEFNRLALKEIALDRGIVPGEIRGRESEVAHYQGAPAAECMHLLERLCQWLNSPRFEPGPGLELVFAIIKAILAHLYIVWIRPFGDGNGRTARLLEFQILLGSGIPEPAAHLLSIHYHRTRAEYYRQIDAASRSGGDVVPFLAYAVQGFLEGLHAQLDQISHRQWESAWRDFVNESFLQKSGAINQRRRLLLLDLALRQAPCPCGNLPELSPRVAKAYAGRVHRTLLRDIRYLAEEGWLTIDGGMCSANRDRVLPYL